eukprot:1430361-Rhodomonas_salina.2
MSGTDICRLRMCYALSSTELRYAATRLMKAVWELLKLPTAQVLPETKYKQTRSRVASYARAMCCPVLT